MQNTSTVKIQLTQWNQHQSELKSIREQVFIQEQNVPIELEWDNEDETALHLLAQVEVKDKSLAIGTARIIINNEHAHIGRMAVLSQWRNQGVGAKILQACIDICQQHGVKQIALNAQTVAIPFYQKVGFQVIGDEFMDAGIPHKKMQLVFT